ncbi:NAD(P)-binding protein [Parathielavia hyrcaniae]|uniref:NAD(P)-binding protein n=1 Tax=Parathielavia hyrcaniae TaxID=113614 RepID=A0AAN6Q2H9_9PEZI|nr:NAD(P)-binding protein [Parathielavia hyrcaniae]
MTLTVLTDEQIRALLENLTVAELESFRVALASALHEHSAGIQGETSPHQPERVSVHSTATGATTLFMPLHNSSGHGVKGQNASTTTDSPPKPAQHAPILIHPTGAITLFTPHGTPLGLLHARTLTAFRTALASLSLVQRRTAPVRTIVAFGCGKQAYWHVRLALLSRARGEVGRVVFVNARRRGGAASEEYERKAARLVGEADVVFCCTPSTEPLFDAGVLLGEEGKGEARLIVAIGSYTPEMKEVPRGLIERADSREEAGVVVVDTIDGALKEAGELIEAGVKAEQLVERSHLTHWLQTGNVIYKSVGMGLMDLSVGMHLIEFAKEKGVGTHVQGF